jgi:protein cornichon
MWEVWVFALCLLISVVLLFAMLFFIISYSDLESDYVNPIDLCSRLNSFVIPEYALHLGLTALLLLNLQIKAVIWNAPLVGWHYYRYSEKKHWHDPTEIFRKLQEHKWEAIAKLIFYVLSFFYYLYRMISALIAEVDY